MSKTTQDICFCHGRNVIYSSYEAVTKDNIVSIIKDSLPLFLENKVQTIYLDKYRKGITPILMRAKKVRPEINNKVNVNRASEIVAFKVGYLLNEPVQYTSRGTDDETVTEKVSKLNDFMYDLDKEANDRTLAENFSYSGTAYRLTLPTSRDSEVPFKIIDLDPECTMVIYKGSIGHEPLLGVMETTYLDSVGQTITRYCCYSDKLYFEVENGSGNLSVTKVQPHYLGMIPVVEFPNNSSRLGDFELVLPILDAINLVYSNRIDGVEQFVQSLMKFINVDISSDDFEKLKELGAIKIKQNGEGKDADVEFITQELHQQDAQVLVDSLYQDVLTICGMPNQIGSNSSTSDNVGSVVVRNGWWGAESRAKSSEILFKKSEKKCLKIVLLAMKIFLDIDLKLSNIDIKLPRRNYENVMQKSTVLTQMLGSDKIHPKLAFESCGLFTDPEVAYIMSENYKKTLEKIANQINDSSSNDN